MHVIFTQLKDPSLVDYDSMKKSFQPQNLTGSVKNDKVE